MKVTDYLAIYAAVLSTAVFIWNVLQSRPRFQIDLVFGMETKDDVVQSGVYIIVRNVSNHDIHLANIGYLYKSNSPTFRERVAHIWRYRRVARRLGWVHSSLSFHSISNRCPVTIEARKAHSVFLPTSAVKSMVEQASTPLIMASAQDELWNNVYSRPFNCSFAGRDDADDA